jgi:hypothetical protein
VAIDIDRSGLGNFATNDISFVHGDPITETKEFDGVYTEPEFVHFVYIRPNDNAASGVSLLAKQFHEPLNGRTIAQAEQEILAKARPGGNDSTVVEYGLEVLDFQDHCCYVTMALDKQYWHFFPDAGQPDAPAIVFRRNKIVIDVDGEVVLEEYDPNHSFYNFENTTVPDGSDGVSAIRFINFFKKDKWGAPEYVRSNMQAEAEQKKQNRYALDIYVRMPFYRPNNLAPNKWATVVIDPPTPPRGGGGGPPPPPG